MKHNEVLVGDFSWVEDPNNDIDKILEDFDIKREEKRKTKYSIKLEDGKVEEVDFENDPDWAFLLEYQEDCYDPDGNYIFDKKIVKNWKYFNQKVDDFEFYIDKAKYILKNYWHYKKEIEYMKQGLHMRKMSYEMLVSVLDNMKFAEKCLATRLSEYSMYLEMLYKEGLSFTSLREFARLLIAKEKFESIGEKMLENAVDISKQEQEVELKQKLELVGELTISLKIKLDNLNK
jgi:hypothetical protein